MSYPPVAGAGAFSVAGSGLTSTGATINVIGTAGRIVVAADAIDLVTTGVTPGNYNSLTLDAYGRATAGSLNTIAGGSGDFTTITASGLFTTTAAFGDQIKAGGIGKAGIAQFANGIDGAFSANVGFNNATGNATFRVINAATGGNVTMQALTKVSAVVTRSVSGVLEAFGVYAVNDGSASIGNFSPTARLHLPAGQAGAGFSPLKIPSGPLLTVSEAGAVEMLTNDWYLTGTTLARKKIALTETSGAFRAPVTGTAAVSGNATLVAGTVTVATTAVTANSIITMSRKTAGGTIGTSATYTISAGVSFTITSNVSTDTSTYSWVITEGF